MNTPKLSTPDRRMLELCEYLITTGEVPNRQAFLDVIKFHKQNFRGVVGGIRSFRVDNITRACAWYRVDANWVHGITDVMRPDPARTRRQRATTPASKAPDTPAVRQSKSQTKTAAESTSPAAGAR